jgi:hypothetical protein
MSEIAAADLSAPLFEDAPRDSIGWGDAWSLCYNEMTRAESSERYARENDGGWVIEHHRRHAKIFKTLCVVIDRIAGDDQIKDRLRELAAIAEQDAAAAAALVDPEAETA